MIDLDCNMCLNVDLFNCFANELSTSSFDLDKTFGIDAACCKTTNALTPQEKPALALVKIYTIAVKMKKVYLVIMSCTIRTYLHHNRSISFLSCVKVCELCLLYNTAKFYVDRHLWTIAI